MRSRYATRCGRKDRFIEKSLNHGRRLPPAPSIGAGLGFKITLAHMYACTHVAPRTMTRHRRGKSNSEIRHFILMFFARHFRQTRNTRARTCERVSLFFTNPVLLISTPNGSFSLFIISHSGRTGARARVPHALTESLHLHGNRKLNVWRGVTANELV